MISFMENVVSINKLNIKDIPILLCTNESKKKKIPIILLHKILCDKETELKIAYHLAQHNYFVIIPDLLMHGEHEDSYEIKNNLDFNEFFTATPKFMSMIELIIEYINHNLENIAITEQITIVGISYGGYLALIAGYWFQEIKYIISINSCGNFSKVMENDTFDMFRLYSRRRPIIDKSKVKQVVDTYDPILNVDLYSNKPIFLLNGALDTTFSKDEILPFVDLLKEVYKNNGGSERIIHKIYARTGHDVNNQMIKDLINWLDINTFVSSN